MPVRIRPARASFNSRASNGDARPDNPLACVDHGLFAQHHAVGRNLVIQCVWVYEHAHRLRWAVGVFTTISVTGCWDGASSVRRCRSPGIGGS